MRRLIAACAACLLPLGGCHGPATLDNAAEADANGSAPAAAPMPGSTPVLLKASDGRDVHGAFYAAENPRAIILLFHQAGSSKGEYAGIAPRLKAMGFDALAIDQRSGGDLYGHNADSIYPTGDKGYLASKADIEGALAWARDKKLPILLWGSSYSAALVFVVAAAHPGEVKALLAFSPAEYLGSTHMVRNAAAKLDIPAFMASSRSFYEKTEADALAYMMRNVPGTVRHDDTELVHGASMLIPAKNPKGAEANWQAVTAFLDKVAPR